MRALELVRDHAEPRHTSEGARSRPRPRIGMLIAFLALLPIATGGPALAQRPAAVGVASVEVSEITDTRPVIGQLVAATESDVATRTAGIIANVGFEIGETVKRGQVLATIDRTLIDIEKTTSEAEVAIAVAGRDVARAELARVQRAFERQGALRRSGAFSRSLFEDLEQEASKARAALAQAEAQLRRAHATLAQIAYRLTHTEIKAPFDGVVIARRAQPGAYIQVGAHIATLMDIGKLEVEADVPVELTASLPPGKTIAARLDNGGNLAVTVRALVPVQSVSTRTRPVRFRADLSSVDLMTLARGKSVTLSVPASAPRKALTVPKDALVQSTRGWLVYAVVEDAAQPRTVTIGDAAGTRIEIKSGLNEGDVVVIRGNERLRPGQPVRADRPTAAVPKRS